MLTNIVTNPWVSIFFTTMDILMLIFNIYGLVWFFFDGLLDLLFGRKKASKIILSNKFLTKRYGDRYTNTDTNIIGVK